MEGVIITGASRGLGAALFQLYHQKGIVVIALSRSFTQQQKKQAAAEPKRIFLLSADLNDPGAISTPALDSCLAQSGITKLTVISNASVVEPIGAIGALDAAAITRAFTVNLVAPAIILNHVITQAAGFQQLCIVNISSGAANRPIEGWAIYCASKAGFRMLTDTLALQCAINSNVKVISIDPGLIDTDMQAAIRNATEEQFPSVTRFRAFKEDEKLQSSEQAAANVFTKINEQCA